MKRFISCWVAFSLALAGLAVGAPVIAPVIAGAGGSDDVFVDRLAVGVTGMLVDGVGRYFRRGGGIYLPTECEVNYQVMIEATPQVEALAFDHEPVLPGFVPFAGGFSYERPCDSGQTSTTVLKRTDGGSVAYFERSLANLLSNLPQNNDKIFRDDFRGGMRRLTVEPQGLESYNIFRQGNLFTLNLECDTPTDVTIFSTPQPENWEYLFEDAPEGLFPITQGFTYTQPCDDITTGVLVEATNPVINQNDIAGILFEQQPRIAGLNNLLTGELITNQESLIGPISLACEEYFAGELLVSPQEAPFTFAYENLPNSVSADELGFIELVNGVPCSQAPTNIVFQAQANNGGVYTNSADINFFIEGREVQARLDGIDITGDGLANIINQEGVLSPPIEWIENFPLSTTILGDADFYTSSIGNLNNVNSWSLLEDSSKSFSLSAQKNASVVQANGELNIRTAQVTRIGEHTLNNGLANLDIACGSLQEKQFFDNLEGIIPTITTTYNSSNTPQGASLSSSGLLSFNFSCDAGSTEYARIDVEPRIFVQGNEGILGGVTVMMNVTGVDQPIPPRIDGVDLSGDGLADITNNNGLLNPALEWVENFPLSVTILGDADSFTSSVGTVQATTWTFTQPTSTGYVLSAQRDTGGLEDAFGTMNLREARIVALGETPLTNNQVDINVPCGVNQNQVFTDNLEGLLPTITTNYSSQNIPQAVTINGTELAYNFACSLGSSEFESFNVTPTITSQGNNQQLEDILVNMTITGVEQLQAPEIFGLEYDASGSNNNPVANASFVNALELVCGFSNQTATSVKVLGDAQSYSLLNNPAWMSVSGDQLLYDVPACEGDILHEVSVQANRGGLIDEAVLRVVEVNPRINSVILNGAENFLQEGAFSVRVFCGEENLGSYVMNILDGWDFDATTPLPAGLTLNVDGTFTYNASCELGSPTQVSFSKQATRTGVSIPSFDTTINISGVAVEPVAPQLFGIVEPEITNVSGVLTPNLEWEKTRTHTI